MINWGVIGCGGIAYRRTIPGMIKAENSRLIAVMDSDPTAAKKVQSEFGTEYAFDSIDRLLAIDEIDAVYIASPVFCHKEQVIAAAKAGKHILLEKPMGLTVSEAKEIDKVCKEYDVMLGVGLMMRFNSIHEKLKCLIEDGKLGEIVSVRSQFTCWYPEIEGAWRQKLETSGGGALMDMGIHCIDLIRFILGMDVSEVTAFTSNQTFSYEVESAASVIMRMENGALAYVDAAFNIPDDATVCKLEVYGTKGSAVIEGSLGQEDSGEGTLIVTDSSKGYDAEQNRVKAESRKLLPESGNLYTKEVAAFADAIINNTKVPVTSHDAIVAQKIVEAAYESASERRAVSVL